MQDLYELYGMQFGLQYQTDPVLIIIDLLIAVTLVWGAEFVHQASNNFEHKLNNN